MWPKLIVVDDQMAIITVISDRHYFVAYAVVAALGQFVNNILIWVGQIKWRVMHSPEGRNNTQSRHYVIM